MKQFPNTVDVNWDHWLKMPTIKLWQAVALSMYVAPENFRAINNQFDAWLEEEVEKPDVQRDIFRNRLELLKTTFFDTNDLHIALVTIPNSNSRVHLDSFVYWALNKAEWDMPKELEAALTTKEIKKLSPAPILQQVVDKPKETEQEKTEDKSPWLIHREGDPEPELLWHISARYFARELVKENSGLLRNKKVLCQKISPLLKDVAIYKRGKKGEKKTYDYTTIRKALANIEFV